MSTAQLHELIPPHIEQFAAQAFNRNAWPKDQKSEIMSGLGNLMGITYHLLNKAEESKPEEKVLATLNGSQARMASVPCTVTPGLYFDIRESMTKIASDKDADSVLLPITNEAILNQVPDVDIFIHNTSSRLVELNKLAGIKIDGEGRSTHDEYVIKNTLATLRHGAQVLTLTLNGPDNIARFKVDITSLSSNSMPKNDSRFDVSGSQELIGLPITTKQGFIDFRANKRNIGYLYPEIPRPLNPNKSPDALLVAATRELQYRLENVTTLVRVNKYSPIPMQEIENLSLYIDSAVLKLIKQYVNEKQTEISPDTIPQDRHAMIQIGGVIAAMLDPFIYTYIAAHSEIHKLTFPVSEIKPKNLKQIFVNIARKYGSQPPEVARNTMKLIPNKELAFQAMVEALKEGAY